MTPDRPLDELDTLVLSLLDRLEAAIHARDEVAVAEVFERLFEVVPAFAGRVMLYLLKCGLLTVLGIEPGDGVVVIGYRLVDLYDRRS